MRHVTVYKVKDKSWVSENPGIVRKNILFKMIIIFILLLSHFHNYLYSQEYRPFIEEGKVWVYYHYERGNSVAYISEIDSLIVNNVVYRKFIFQGGFYVYCREDRFEKKVYIYQDSTELLMYDFGLEIGDTFPFIDSKIDTIIEYYDGLENRQRIFSFKDSYYNIYEGIGSKKSLLNFYFHPLGEELAYCYKKNGKILYRNDEICGSKIYCEIVGLSNSKNANVRINLFDQVLNIDGIEEKMQFSLFSLSGMLVGQYFSYGENKMNIPLANLNSGLYILNCMGNEDVRSFKIAVP